MKLRDWLKANKTTMETFSRAIGTSVVNLSRWCSGHHIPGKDFAIKIAIATGGQVLPNDFYDLPKTFPKAKAPQPVTVRVTFNGKEFEAEPELAEI